MKPKLNQKKKKTSKKTRTSQERTRGLVSLADRPHAEVVEIGRKGGLVSSPAKRYAAKLRELKKKLNRKKKGSGNELEQKMLALMEDPDYSIFDLRMYAETIKSHVTNARDRIALMRALTEVHKAQHGTK